MKGCLIGCGVVCLLGVLLAAIGGIMLYRWGKQGISEDPVTVGGWLEEIAQCRTPDGYAPRFGMNYTVAGAGMKIIFIAPEEVAHMDDMEGWGKKTAFIVFSMPGVPEEAVREAFENQEQQGFMGSPPNGTDVSTLETKTVDIQVANGIVKARRSVRTADDESTISYDIFIRPDAMLSAVGPVDEFDQEAFETLMNSITVPDAEDDQEPDD